MQNLRRLPKMGLLLIGSKRFRPLGEGTVDGTYEARKNKEAETIVNAAKEFSEVTFSGIIYEKEQVIRAMDDFYHAKVDFVLAMYLSWAEDFSWIRFLRDIHNVPLLFGCLVRDSCQFTDTSDENEFVGFLSSGSIVGTLEASGSFARFNRRMTDNVIGNLESLMKKAYIFGQSAKLRNILKYSTFGLLACYNEVMWSTYVDPYSLFEKVGPELKFLSIATLVDEIDCITEGEVENIIRRLSSIYPVLPDVDRSKLVASVRASMAVEKLARKNEIQMVVLNDVDSVLFEQVGLRPGFLPIPDTEDVMVVPEGDIGGGLAVYILKLLTGKHVSFIEPFYIDAQNNYFAAGHAGPNDYTDPMGTVKIARDVRFAKTSYKHAGAPFAWYLIPPGEKTMLHISQCNGRFKIVCMLVDAVECDHFLASYSHGMIKPRVSVNELFGKLMEIGVTQHYALVEGDYIGVLRAFANIMDFEFYLI